MFYLYSMRKGTNTFLGLYRIFSSSRRHRFDIEKGGESGAKRGAYNSWAVRNLWLNVCGYCYIFSLLKETEIKTVTGDIFGG